MKKNLSLILLFAMLAGVLGACSAKSSSSDSTRTINVAGTGEVYLVPDIAYVYIGTRSQAADVATALTDNNNQAAAISSELQGMGIDPLDIQTTAFNVYPLQNYGPDGQPTDLQFVVENTVFVKVKQLPILGELLDAVVRKGANQINGISFDVQDRKQAESDARNLAIQDAKDKATEIAAAAGVGLGDLMNINVYSSGNPQPIFDAKGGGAMNSSSSAPIASGQLLITADANLTYNIK